MRTMTELMTTDFVSSFRKGQEKAEIATNARLEVFTIVHEAASQLETETDKKLTLNIYNKPINLIIRLGEWLSSLPIVMEPIQEKELAFGIGASNPTVKTPPAFLASVQFDVVPPRHTQDVEGRSLKWLSKENADLIF
jgi:hypothetical protein